MASSVNPCPVHVTSEYENIKKLSRYFHLVNCPPTFFPEDMFCSIRCCNRSEFNLTANFHRFANCLQHINCWFHSEFTFCTRTCSVTSKDTSFSTVIYLFYVKDEMKCSSCLPVPMLQMSCLQTSKKSKTLFGLVCLSV